MGLLAETILVGLALLASVRYGAKQALLGVVVLGMAIAWVSVELGLLLAKAALCGVLLDLGRRARVSFGRMVTVAMLPAGVVAVALSVFPLFDAEKMAHELLSRAVGAEGWLPSLYREGPSQEALRDLLAVLLRLAPGAGFLSTLVGAFLAYVLCRRWLLRRGVELPAVPRMASWRLWDHLVWLLTLGIGLVVFGAGRADALGWNLIVVMGALYLLQGLAVLRFRLSRSGTPTSLVVLLYVILALTFSVSVFLVIGVGVLDIWLPLRRGEPSDVPA